MDIGIPKEARPREHRVALAPSATIAVVTTLEVGMRI